MEKGNIFEENTYYSRKQIGELGENIALRYLKSKGFVLREMNYRKKWGEIDIIVEKNKKIHFVEVKTISRASHMKNTSLWYRPEDNIHPWKLERLYKTIQSYCIEIDGAGEREWQLDLVAIYLDVKNKKAKIDYLENIS